MYELPSLWTRHTHHDDGDGQENPVEEGRIPVDGLNHGLGHVGRQSVCSCLSEDESWLRLIKMCLCCLSAESRSSAS